jgi:hypothetical protein
MKEWDEGERIKHAAARADRQSSGPATKTLHADRTPRADEFVA